MEKVMIIENNAMMRLFLTNYLAGSYEVETAKTPMEAMRKMNGSVGDFSLVISDYQTPGSNEMEALESLEMSMRWQNVPLIVLTDEDKSAQRIAAFECGATDCLSKPFNPKELKMRMKSLVKSNAPVVRYSKVA